MHAKKHLLEQKFRTPIFVGHRFDPQKPYQSIVFTYFQNAKLRHGFGAQNTIHSHKKYFGALKNL